MPSIRFKALDTSALHCFAGQSLWTTITMLISSFLKFTFNAISELQTGFTMECVVFLPARSKKYTTVWRMRTSPLYSTFPPPVGPVCRLPTVMQSIYFSVKINHIELICIYACQTSNRKDNILPQRRT